MQFIMQTGNPEVEVKFQENLKLSEGKTIFGFHGSAVENWHSIIRNGFNLKRITSGRLYGFY